MVDGDALRQAFGTTLDDGKLGVPAGPHEVEKIVDPKQALDQAFRQVVGRQRRRKKSAADFPRRDRRARPASPVEVSSGIQAVRERTSPRLAETRLP